MMASSGNIRNHKEIAMTGYFLCNIGKTKIFVATMCVYFMNVCVYM